jgi:Tfp pilus assembly protein PilN
MLMKTSAGIEISGKDLKLAVVRGSGKKLRLVKTLEIPGFVDMSVEEQKMALATLVKEHKIPQHRVFLTLSRDLGTLRQLEFPSEIGDKLRSAIALQVEALSPWPADEIYWDFSQEPLRKGVKTLRVTVVVIPREALDPWIALFKEAGLPLSGASLSSSAQAHGIGVLWPGDAPTVALDCQEGRVEGCLVQGGQLSSLTQVPTQAGDDATATARSAVERLMAVGRLSSLSQARLLTFGPACSTFEQREHVALPMEGAALDSSDRFGSISTAMLGLRKTGFESNLIPPEVRYQHNHLQWIPTYALLGLGLLLGVALLGREPYQQTVYASQIDAEIQRIAPVANVVVGQQAELNTLSEKYRVLSGHFRNRDYALEALRELSRTLPASAWISSYNYQDGIVTISGLADTASEIQKALEDNPLFKDVQFSGSVNRDAKGKDRFTLKAAIEVTQ